MEPDYSRPPQICARCLYTTWHPLGLVLDEDGVCSGCRVHEEKRTLDWNARWRTLEETVAPYQGKKSGRYDCIVPVSGARDSFFIMDVVTRLGLKPLMVTYNKLYNTDLGIRNLARLRTVFDADILTLTVSPDSVRRITHSTLRRRGSLYWHCIAGQTVFPVQCAVRMGVPLIIWGAHQGLDQVGMYSHEHAVEMTRRYRKDHDLMGLEAEDLVSEFDHLKEKDVASFLYPSYQQLRKAAVRGIYLGNFMPWDTKLQHEEMLQKYGYETAPQTRTFDTYNDVDCFNYSDVHDYLKFMKHGYGKATDHAVRELRFGRLSREDAITLAKTNRTKNAENLEQFLSWSGIEPSAFEWIVDQHRNPALWRRTRDWQWDLSLDLLELPVPDDQLERARLSPQSSSEFRLTPNKRPDYADRQYVCIGKGTPCR
jgi:N-acetyl sugar amidotransferase